MRVWVEVIREAAIQLIQFSCRAARNGDSLGHVLRNNGSCRHRCLLSDRNTGQHDRSWTDVGTGADARIEIQASRHVMGEDDRFLIDHCARPDMNTLGPGSINICCGCDDCGSIDVHTPDEPPIEHLQSALSRLGQPFAQA